MAVIIPEEAELRSRILAHLASRPGNPYVGAVWSGYLAGLLEWGVIDGNVHSRLSDLLPMAGESETLDVMLGPDYVDAHPELRTGARPEQRRPVRIVPTSA